MERRVVYMKVLQTLRARLYRTERHMAVHSLSKKEHKELRQWQTLHLDNKFNPTKDLPLKVKKEHNRHLNQQWLKRTITKVEELLHLVHVEASQWINCLKRATLLDINDYYIIELNSIINYNIQHFHLGS